MGGVIQALVSEVMKGHRDHSTRIILLWHTGSSLCKCSGYFVSPGDTAGGVMFIERHWTRPTHPLSTSFPFLFRHLGKVLGPLVLCKLGCRELSFRKSEQKTEIFTSVFAWCLPRTEPLAAVPCCFVGGSRHLYVGQ